MSGPEIPDRRTELQSNQIHTLSVVYVSSLSLSLIGSLSVLLVSFAKRRILNEQVQPLLQLATADFLAAAVLLCTSAINLVAPSQLPDGVLVCERGLPLSLTFFFISFLLIIIYGYKSRQMVEVWRERSSQSQDWGVTHRGAVEKRFTWNYWTKGCSPLYIVVWCAPIAGYFGYVFTESLTQADLFTAPGDTTVNESVSDHAKFCTSCMLLLHIRNDSCSHVDSQHGVSLRWFLLASAVLVIMCCFATYCRLSDRLQTYEERALFPVEGDGFSRKHLRGMRFTARSMVLVIVLCWSPAVLLFGLSFVETVPQERLFPLYILQALTVSLQGFLDSIVYAWLRRNFREAALGEGVPLLAGVPAAFFDDSLPRVP